MQRIIEPELMDNPSRALSFANASRENGIRGFLDLYKKYGNLSKGTIIDLGCGPGTFLFALEEQYPELTITGYDGSEAMIQIGKNIAKNKNSNIKFQLSQFKDIDVTADCVISTNTLHHLHDPVIFWKCVKRVSSRIFVMDLVRPSSTSIAKNIVNTLALAENNDFQSDFYNSLLAAFSIEELKDQIKEIDLELVVKGDSNFLQVAVIYD
jgi:2-polyprenyl-3-methyl-5-hydroxy-6-metoxy-1,4-benzoquinol methylase